MLIPLQLTLIFFPTHPRITMSFCAFAAPMQVVTAAMCSWCQQPCHTQKAALHGTPPHSPALTVFTPSRRGALILHLFMKRSYELLLNNFKSPVKLCYVLSTCILIGIFYTRYFDFDLFITMVSLWLLLFWLKGNLSIRMLGENGWCLMDEWSWVHSCKIWTSLDVYL